MKIKDIIYGDKFSVWCKFNRNDAVQDMEGSIKYINDRLLFCNKNFHDEIEILDKTYKLSLDTNFARGYENFAYIRNKKDNKYLVTIIFFAGKADIRDISISYDDNIIQSPKDRGIKENNISSDLVYECVLDINNEKYIMVMNQFYTDDSESSDNSNKNAENEKNDIQNESLDNKANFVILGKSYKLYIQRNNIKNDPYYAINKIVPNISSKHNEYMPILVKVSNITFKKKIEILKPYLDEYFQKIINNKDDKSYFGVWEKYTDLERNKVVEKAKCILKCLKSKENSDGIIYTFAESKYFNKIETGDTVVFVDKIPDYIREIKDEPTIDELGEILSKIIEIQEQYKDNILYDVIEIKTDNSIKLKSKINKCQNVKNQYAVILLKGEIIQLERKINAVKNIKSGVSSNPMLRFLIEGCDNLLFNNKAKNEIKPVSYSMKNKVFKNYEPTPNQIEAISIALNTPDIALIQGPPGTGKTTVINAVLERLNEEYYKEGNKNAGRVLVTAFQHDAVDNIVSKLKINAIPGIKFGGKNEDENKLSKELESFCNNISEKINEKYEFKEDKLQKELKKLIRIYENEPAKNNALRLLEFMYNLDALKFNDKLKHDIKNQIEIFKQRKYKSENNFDLKNIYAIRLDEKSFADDGRKILIKLKDNKYLNEKDRERISAIIKNTSTDIKGCLKDLQDFKNELLDKYMPENEFKKNKVNNHILNLAEQVMQELIDKAPRKDKINQIVYDFKQELEDNIESVIASLKKYSIAFAATIQQSKGLDIGKHKLLPSSNAEYDVVIVDEAARSNPMDLFVALEQAKNKIILVGDHRQLPHIVDEDIKAKLEQGIYVDVENYDKNLLDISIFEYLLENIKKLEKKDGIKRHITLDTQYRTHNILGDFINENFYKEHNECFTSTRQYSEFKIGITDIQKPCIWYNIKNSKEDKESGSRYNKSEIRFITDKLTEWIEQGEINESIGIISFYRAQADKIKENLPNDNRINELIANNKLEIGTVDAFQGKEFDIIILSLVRCGNTGTKQNKSSKEALFGHLMSENRMCVAMSRAKRALIVVGDFQFIIDKAESAVPALYNYAKLCGTKDGEIIDVR